MSHNQNRQGLNLALEEGNKFFARRMQELRSLSSTKKIVVTNLPAEDCRFIQVGKSLHCVTNPGQMFAWDEHLSGRYD